LMALIEKGADADFLREMIEVISNRLMEMEVEGLTGAAHGERSVTRVNQRNGYRERAWETRVGTVDLSFAKFRALPNRTVCNFSRGRASAQTGDGVWPDYDFCQSLKRGNCQKTARVPRGQRGCHRRRRGADP
jgi:Transposase, Mutator family